MSKFTEENRPTKPRGKSKTVTQYELDACIRRLRVAADDGDIIALAALAVIALVTPAPDEGEAA